MHFRNPYVSDKGGMIPFSSYGGIGERKKVIFSDDLTTIQDTAPENGL